MKHNAALTIYNPEVENFININFDIKVLDDSCSFAEGPVWNNEGYYLFSDIPQNVICKIAPGIKKEIYINKSGCTHSNTHILGDQIGSNGLTYNQEGYLLICQHGNGAIAKWNGEEVQPFLVYFNDHRFNSPNDIIVHCNGTIFFTDPPYGLKDQKLIPEDFQPIAGLYCYRNGNVQLITDQYQYPNGVCLSADGTTLYCCSNKPTERFIQMFDTETLAAKGTLCNENSDGIKVDKWGNFWLCTKEGILIVNNTGERLAKIELPTVPANCCWGGAQENDLLITAREIIFLIPHLQKESYA